VAAVLAVTTPPSPGLSATLVKRALTTVIGVPLFVWVVVAAPRWVFALLVVAASALAAWELLRMFERAGRPGYSWLAVVGTAATTASFATPGFPGLAAVVFTLVVAITLSVPVWVDSVPAVEPVATTMFAIVYIGWLLGHGLLLRLLTDGAHLVLLLVGTTWAGESAAYVVGSALGRHPLAPVISPRKTVEGAVGQLTVSIVTAAGLGTWLVPQWSMSTAILAGALLGIVGQVGDLVESAIKRSLGAKDTGGLIPGHGGVLDRLDGILFNAPALFYYASYASWVGGRG
jgi:phosphatidate cytidylyltransferase